MSLPPRGDEANLNNMVNEDLKDWEQLPEEMPPEKLVRKWVERDHFGKKFALCPSCQKEVPAENLTCIFCGARICENSGLLGNLLGWFKRLFRKQN